MRRKTPNIIEGQGQGHFNKRNFDEQKRPQIEFPEVPRIKKKMVVKIIISYLQKSPFFSARLFEKSF